jgi:hypothetical protein
MRDLNPGPRVSCGLPAMSHRHRVPTRNFALLPQIRGHSPDIHHVTSEGLIAIRRRRGRGRRWRTALRSGPRLRHRLAPSCAAAVGRLACGTLARAGEAPADPSRPASDVTARASPRATERPAGAWPTTFVGTVAQRHPTGGALHGVVRGERGVEVVRRADGLGFAGVVDLVADPSQKRVNKPRCKFLQGDQRLADPPTTRSRTGCAAALTTTSIPARKASLRAASQARTAALVGRRPAPTGLDRRDVDKPGPPWIGAGPPDPAVRTRAVGQPARSPEPGLVHAQHHCGSTSSTLYVPRTVSLALTSISLQLSPHRRRPEPAQHDHLPWPCDLRT